MYRVHQKHMKIFCNEINDPKTSFNVICIYAKLHRNVSL